MNAKTPSQSKAILTEIVLPNEPFEAAKVDGASNWQIFTKITIPMLYPFIGLALLFRSIDAFKTFSIFLPAVDCCFAKSKFSLEYFRL